MILVLGLLVLLPGFETLPAVDRDEARFAQSSRQMLETGDYFDIRLGDEARFKKPVGIYWLQAAATALAGGEDPSNPIWTYRLPSLMGALLSLIVTLSIGRRWFGAGAGFAAAALLAVSLMLAFEARQAMTDAFLLLTILVLRPGNGRCLDAGSGRHAAAGRRLGGVLGRNGHRHPGQGADHPARDRPDGGSSCRCMTGASPGSAGCARGRVFC